MRRFAVLLAVLCLPAAFAAGSAGAAECPNAALRVGPSAFLPGCRAYEMVSPVDKNDGNVSSTMSLHAAPTGNAVSFGSTASFAGSPASPLGGTYIARRGSNWATEGVDPPQFNHSGLLIRGTPMSSADLRFSFGVSSMALTAGAQEGGSNLYLRDNATGSRTLLAATSGTLLALETSGAGGGSFLGASADWSHVLIGSREALPVTPSEPAPAAGQENIYDLTGGVAHLVNVLPGEIVDLSGAHIGSSNMPYQHLISEDGSKTFFQVGGFGAGPLYLRENDTTTIPISVSQNGAEAGEMEPAEFGVATPDGSIVYFTSTSELIEGAGPNALYRYDVRTGETTAMIPSPPTGEPEVRHVLGASRDGSYVYFSSSAALAKGATHASGSGVNFYVWHDGVIKWIAQTESTSHEYSFPQQWSVSPDGKVLGLASESALTEEDVLSAACPTDPYLNNQSEHCVDVYAYEFDTNQLKCLSCKWGVGPGGESEWLPGRGFSELGGQGTHESGMGDEFPHAALDNGTVFFDTPNSLLSRDVNGVGDVYAWREGTYELVSTGRGEQPSTFGDSTPDGSDVFFLTKQQLVKQDTDESTDVYDERELGGLASQWPPEAEPPCKGEGCRGASSSPPAGLPQGAAAAGKSAPRSCTAIRAKAKKASRQARRLAKRARRSAKRSGANAQSRRLRRKATTARKRAHRIHQKAATCGRKG